MVVKQAIPGNVFDVDSQLTALQCSEFLKAGYITAIRYIPRSSSLLAGNLTQIEIETILESGLSLSCVQHCPLPGWLPSAALGKQYGDFAAWYANDIGLPKGMNIFLDLETPSSHATDDDCINYANSWYSAVSLGGYIPGVYLGYGIPMTPLQLYKWLAFKNYWRAYNGPDLSGRGYQIIQKTAEVLNGVNFDPNIVAADNEGDLPIFLSP